MQRILVNTPDRHVDVTDDSFEANNSRMISVSFVDFLTGGRGGATHLVVTPQMARKLAAELVETANILDAIYPIPENSALIGA